MKRRAFLGSTAAAGIGLVAGQRAVRAGAGDNSRNRTMKAGFARVSITPPIGTTMMGFGTRDMDHGCEAVHDDIYVRALFVESSQHTGVCLPRERKRRRFLRSGGESALILAYDLCFVGREEADRYKGAIGRVLNLHPRQILMNTSHSHVGPSVGTWYSAGYEMHDRDYLGQLERATVAAAVESRNAMTEVTLEAGVTRSALPVNRRRKMDDGSIQNRPNPGGYAYDKLPICLLKDSKGKPVCILFSISCHPSMMGGFEISGEYPGAAMRRLDERFGTACSLFLQGVGGDAKPLVIGRGGVDRWQTGTWELMEEAGAIVAGEVLDAVEAGLAPVTPNVRTASVEMTWALTPAPPRSFFEEIVAATAPENREKSVQYMWAAKTLERLDRGDVLPRSVTLTAHGVQLGDGLRIVGLEGEATAPWGPFIEDFYGSGITMPLGYCDGTGLYLPNSAMLPEGGYEVVSFWEYGLPSQLAPGMEDEVRKALVVLREQGIR